MISCTIFYSKTNSKEVTVLEKKIFKDLASFCGFSIPVWKIIRTSEPFEQIIKRPTQGTFMSKIRKRS
jgi:hypothetical protein